MSKPTVVFVILNGWENKRNKKNTSWCEEIDDIKMCQNIATLSFLHGCCEPRRHSWAVVTETVWPEIIWPISKILRTPDLELHSMDAFNPSSCPEVHTQSLIAVLTTHTRPRWERLDPELKVTYSVGAKEKESQPSLNSRALWAKSGGLVITMVSLTLGCKHSGACSCQVLQQSSGLKRHGIQIQAKQNSKVKETDPLAHKLPS